MSLFSCRCFHYDLVTLAWVAKHNEHQRVAKRTHTRSRCYIGTYSGKKRNMYNDFPSLRQSKKHHSLPVLLGLCPASPVRLSPLSTCFSNINYILLHYFIRAYSTADKKECEFSRFSVYANDYNCFATIPKSFLIVILHIFFPFHRERLFLVVLSSRPFIERFLSLWMDGQNKFHCFIAFVVVLGRQ